MKKELFAEFSKYVSLNILAMIAYSCYTLADTFFVSADLGADGLAALNLAFPALCIINGTGLLLGMGGGTRYAIAKSRSEHEHADKIFTNAIYLVVLFSVTFVLVGVFLSKPIVRLLGADETIFDMTNTYLQTMLFFAPAFLLNYFLQCFVRNDGRPSLSMAAMITGSLSNVLLDWVFIFPLKMGIFGAILATGLAPIISIFVIAPYLIMKKNSFAFAKCAPSGRSIVQVLSSGVPSFVTEASSGVVMLVFNCIILRLAGTVGVAAYGVVAAVSLVVIAIYNGLSQGVQPVLSRKYGENNPSDVQSVFRYALAAMAIISVILYAVLALCAPSIVSVFNGADNAVLQEIAVGGYRIYFAACPFAGFTIVLATYFTSTGKPLPAQIISLLRGIIVIVPMAFLLSSLFKMTGVWLAFPATELLTAIIGLILFLKVNAQYHY
ncbi:MAG: MATE family efflux transporter [Treponema sp.]|nr:MATE family efflux transporter [Treponema sp.]